MYCIASKLSYLRINEPFQTLKGHFFGQKYLLAIKVKIHSRKFSADMNPTEEIFFVTFLSGMQYWLHGTQNVICFYYVCIFFKQFKH